MREDDPLGAPPHVTIELVADRTASSRCDEGFLTLRRLTLRNRYDDGEGSAEYAYDLVERTALDAVAIVLVTRDGRVCLRSALRPPLAFRGDARTPLPDPADASPVAWEVPAGLVEPDEEGEAGLRGCAVRETLEEVGLTVAEEAFVRLGPPTYLSPGVIAEMLHYYVAVVDERGGAVPTEDGSPVEERAEVRFIPLSDALAACRSGRIADVKTEISIRRLAERFSLDEGAGVHRQHGLED